MLFKKYLFHFIFFPFSFLQKLKNKKDDFRCVIFFISIYILQLLLKKRRLPIFPNTKKMDYLFWKYKAFGNLAPEAEIENPYTKAHIRVWFFFKSVNLYGIRKKLIRKIEIDPGAFPEIVILIREKAFLVY